MISGETKDFPFPRVRARALSARARSRHPQRPSGAQAGGQLAAQGSAALNIKRLIDGLVTDAHRLVAREVQPQPVGDLLRAPRPGPPAVLTRPVPAASPLHGWPGDRHAVRRLDPASQPILHIPPQHRVDRQLHRLGAAGGPVGMPLRGRRAVVELAAPRGGVAAQLARDRGRRASQTPSDLADTVPLRTQQGDLLPLHEG
jgi:hypothetical protein